MFNKPSQSITQTRQKPRVCLESSIFSALFGPEGERSKAYRSILLDAQEKRIECFVSALMLVECDVANSNSIGKTETAEESTDVLFDIFESEAMTRCNVDPFVGELARSLKSQLAPISALSPQQWLWLATALLQECDYLMTYEPRLLKLAGQPVLGEMKVTTPVRPWSSGQLTLQDYAGVMDGVAAEAPALGLIARRSIEI